MTRSIFITGASSGIGEALAVEFARRGYAVAVAARRFDRLEALAARLPSLGAARALPLVLDVTDAAGIDAALRHRMLINFEGQAEGIRPDDVVRDVLATVG